MRHWLRGSPPPLHILLALLAVLTAVAAQPSTAEDAQLDARARVIHERVLTLDSHVDVIVPGAVSEYGPGTPEGVLQVLELSKAPVVASHSAVRALVDNTRNLSDQELDAIKANGGVVQLTAFNAYLVARPSDYTDRVHALRARFDLAPDYPNTPVGFISGADALSTERHQEFVRGGGTT